MTSPLGFKARVGSLICSLWKCVSAADLLVVSMAAEPFLSTYLRTGIGGDQNRDRIYHAATASQCEKRQTLYRLGNAGSAPRLQLNKLYYTCLRQKTGNMVLHGARFLDAALRNESRHCGLKVRALCADISCSPLLRFVDRHLKII